MAKIHGRDKLEELLRDDPELFAWLQQPAAAPRLDTAADLS